MREWGSGRVRREGGMEEGRKGASGGRRGGRKGGGGVGE